MALIRRVADKLTLRTADLSKAFFFFFPLLRIKLIILEGQ